MKYKSNTEGMVCVYPVGGRPFYLSREVLNKGDDPVALRTAAPTAGELVTAILGRNESQRPLSPELLECVQKDIDGSLYGNKVLVEVTTTVVKNEKAKLRLFPNPESVRYDSNKGIWLVEGKDEIIDPPKRCVDIPKKGEKYEITKFDEHGFPLEIAVVEDKVRRGYGQNAPDPYMSPDQGLSVVCFVHRCGSSIHSGFSDDPVYELLHFLPIPLDRGRRHIQEADLERTGARRIVREPVMNLPESVTIQGADIERLARLLRTHPGDPAAAATLLNRARLGNYPMEDK